MQVSQLASVLSAKVAARRGLTISETDVLAGLIAGRSPEDISRERNCAAATVRVHIRALHAKLNINRSTALLRIVLEEVCDLNAAPLLAHLAEPVAADPHAEEW